MSESPLETETLHDTTTFEHFDREWTIPTKRHLSHIKKMRDELRAGVLDYNLLTAETFLTPDDLDALLDIDPDEDAFEEFIQKIAKSLGLGDKGNS